MYTEKDNQKLQSNIEDLKTQSDNLILNILEPTRDKRWDIIYTIRDFVIEKKRKLYGGFALNELIKEISPEDVFYDEKNVKCWDIDFYSPEPINDAQELANRLHEKGYKHIRASEAIHDETYKIYVETEEFADITYVPRPIYNKIPFKTIDGINITGPHWLMIDYLRILTDPLTSWFRLEKIFPRLCALVKHFPLPHNNSVIDIEPPTRDLKIAFDTVYDYLVDNKTCIAIGMYAYNHLLKESTITTRKLSRTRTEDNKQNTRGTKQHNENIETKMNYVDINYFEIISTNYKTDAKNLILKLKEKFQNAETKITYEEYYPFFQFFGFSVNIYFDGEIICKLYHYNYKCVPYKEVPALYFTERKAIERPGKINIGSFALLMLYNLSNIMYAKTYNDHRSKNIYYTLISHINEMKIYYFNKFNKDIFDDTLFQEFILTCTGYTMTAIREKQERIQKKKDAGKTLYAWNYYPDKNIGKDVTTTYVFANSSGNVINNAKNKQITFE